jgi:hypothetical protein
MPARISLPKIYLYVVIGDGVHLAFLKAVLG